MERNRCIDMARSICTIWIVVFWHRGEVYDIANRYTYCLTISVLSTFVYLSGYLAGNHRFDKKGSFFFIVKRLKRIYPMFFISASFFCFYMHAITFRQYLKIIFGVALFCPPAPITIWFVNLMFLYWIITPIILKDNVLQWKYIILIFVFFVVVVVLGCDIRMLLYYPSYIAGLVCDKKECMDRMNLKGFFWLPSVLVFLVLSVSYIERENILSDCFFKIIIVLLGTYILTGISAMLSGCRCLNSFSTIISYLSMALYFFHRPLYYFLDKLVKEKSIVYIYFIVIPLVFISSFLIQYGYDYIIRRFEKNKNR